MRIICAKTSIRNRQAGIASVIMLILLALVLTFIIANINTLSALHNDVKRLEQRQIRRINPVSASTITISPKTQPAK